MVYETRAYRLSSDTLPEYLRLINETGIRIQEYLGNTASPRLNEAP